MFVMTIKWNKRVATAIVLGAALLLAAIVIGVGNSRDISSFAGIFSSRGLKSNADRVKYLEDLGWKCDPEPITEQSIIIPRSFDGVIDEYNKLQLRQGFDLQRYAGLEAQIYQYSVTNYPGSNETVIAQIIVLNYQVIGGDIHSTAMDGFMHGLK